MRFMPTGRDLRICDGKACGLVRGEVKLLGSIHSKIPIWRVLYDMKEVIILTVKLLPYYQPPTGNHMLSMHWGQIFSSVFLSIILQLVSKFLRKTGIYSKSTNVNE